ncbi:MAG: hypothetical protein ACYTE8_02105 [Planctomycetota bacterium]|jgi:uncharacterized membrane protein
MSLKENPLERRKLYTAIIVIVVLAVCCLAFFTPAFDSFGQNNILSYMVPLIVLLFLMVGILILSRITKTTQAVREHAVRIEKVAEAVEKNRSVLEEINKNTRISESAKTIASRDINRQALREAVFDKLQQNDFQTAYDIIKEIEKRQGKVHAGYCSHRKTV